VKNLFNVNEAELRELFLLQKVGRAIEGLDAVSTPRWGRMSAQEMLEHLIWAFELSNGGISIECFVAPERWPRMKEFLYSNRPTPQDFMNPALADGLPPLRHRSLSEAKSALRFEMERFLDRNRCSEEVYTHPIFGPIGYEEWHRVHYKHTYHHLLQFGLIELEE
jgi:oxepin-CoA hydrolase/3-oxo-5,6-dehydrosuberyl-CoA semialdehyde dehydrogenase